ncbi:Hydroxyacid oxidase 1 [Chelonia mydas]|uniref:(S)-2-hydroxy-acid oxidase n=1 Tax=Chelonia mydas TaxID=8469 RepID=M7B3S0_CHEMY|nr:Hydroxyacid oxidase 1 [Chelonia mydas]
MSGKPVCVGDFEQYAKRVLPKAVYDYYRSGADNQQTLADNVAAFSRLRLYPRMLRDVSVMDLSTAVLGQKISMPICVGATAMQCMAHVDGEAATARACRSLGTGMMLSSWATSTIEEVAQAAPDGLHWLQLYIYKDREVTRSLVQRAERAGYKGIFVTVDTPLLGKRFDDVRNKFQLPPHLRMKNFDTNDLAFSSEKGYGENSGLAVYVAQAIDPSIKWEDITWLRGLTSLPIVAKGILRADDAREAVKHGVNGILVSNHGARQLDGVPATIDVLPEIVEAVEGKAEVFLDGGVRKGTDVLKALALGAKAVFIGRPIIWGLVYQGEEGAKEVLQMLKEEFQLAMALSDFAGSYSTALHACFILSGLVYPRNFPLEHPTVANPESAPLLVAMVTMHVPARCCWCFNQSLVQACLKLKWWLEASSAPGDLWWSCKGGEPREYIPRVDTAQDMTTNKFARFADGFHGAKHIY